MEIGLERRNSCLCQVLSTIVHAAALINFTIALGYRTYIAFNKEKRTNYLRFGYNFKNLNSLNSLVQIFYNSVALCVDITIWQTYTRDAPRLCILARSHLRAMLAFPFGMFVTIVYWILVTHSKTWLYYKNFKQHEVWLGHMLHTFNPLFLILDILVCKGEPSSYCPALLLIAAIHISYDVWIHILYLGTNVWISPMVGSFSFLGKLIVYLALFLFHYGLFLVGKVINDFLWDDVGLNYIPCLPDCVKKYREEKPQFKDKDNVSELVRLQRQSLTPISVKSEKSPSIKQSPAKKPSGKKPQAKKSTGKK